MDLPSKRNRESSEQESVKRVYTFGVFDLFHYGHMRMFAHCKEEFPGAQLVVGVLGDNGLTTQTVLSQSERGESVSGCRWVDEVICPCPDQPDVDFLKEHTIDLVVYAGELERVRQDKVVYMESSIGLADKALLYRMVKDMEQYIDVAIEDGYSSRQLGVSLGRFLQGKGRKYKDQVVGAFRKLVGTVGTHKWIRRGTRWMTRFVAAFEDNTLNIRESLSSNHNA